MKHYERIAASSAATLILLSGCETRTASSAQAPAEIPNATVESSIDQLRDFWVRKGIAGAADVASVVLTDGVIGCANSDGTTQLVFADKGVANYCAPSTIVITRAGLRYTSRIAQANNTSASDTTLTVLAHEFGHDIEYETHETARSHRSREQLADCLAGMVIADIRPAAIPAGEALFHSVPADAAHGTGAQRAAAFLAGTTPGADCGIAAL